MAEMAAPLPRPRVPAPALRVLGDDRLFRLAAAGDTRAFEAIYERHHQALYRYCRSIVGNAEDAADALQSTMASALRGLAGEQRQIALKPWLFRIAHNESISLLRKRRPHVAIDDALELEAPAHDPAVAERLGHLVADLRELPDAQRGALVMRELSGLRYVEIAAALGTTEPHARQLVYEARTGLHDLAEGRAMACDSVRRAISDADRRVLRGRRIRSHLRACSDCAEFDQLMRSRKRDLAAIAPPIPAALAAGLLHNLLGGASAGTAASSAGAGSGSVLAGKALATSVVAKTAAAVAVTAVAGAGALEIAHTAGGSHAGTTAAPAVRSGSPASSRGTPSATGVTPHRSTAKRTAGAGGSAGTRSSQGGGTRAHRPARAHRKGSHHAHPRHPSHPPRPTHPDHPPHPSHPSPPTITPPKGGKLSTPAPLVTPTTPTPGGSTKDKQPASAVSPRVPPDDGTSSTGDVTQQADQLLGDTAHGKAAVPHP